MKLRAKTCFLALFALMLAAAPFWATGCGRRSVCTGVLLVTTEGNVAAPVVRGRTFAHRTVLPVSPETLPSAASALTGLFPPEHGLRVDGVGVLGTNIATIAESFASRGYACGAFSSSCLLSPVHGLDRGFDAYDAPFVATNRAAAFTRDSAATVDAALAWMAAQPKGRDVFVWVHLTPFAGVARTNLIDTAELGSLALERNVAAREIGRLVESFSTDSPVLVLPLFGLGIDPDFRGLSLDDPAFRTIDAWVSGIGAHPLGVADVPFSLGVAEEPPPGRYMESPVPWYVFRLPPLQRKEGDLPVDLCVLTGLTTPAPAPLAHEGSERIALRASGRYGEGLVPPCTNVAFRASLAPEDVAGRIARARDALHATGTNLEARLEALVQSDPGVPLFHRWLGEALFRKGDCMAACNAFGRAAALGYNMVGAHRRQMRCHLRIGNIPAAIESAETAYLENPDDPLPRHELASILLRAGAGLLEGGEFKAANDCLSRVLLLEPKNAAALRLVAEMKAKMEAGHDGEK